MTTTDPDPGARQCIKCGRPVGPEESICADCNAAGMATPSASQYHGTVAVAIVGAVVALGIAASLSLRGVGPYAAEVRAVAPGAVAGFAISYAVTNTGTNAGRAKCQIVALGDAGERLRALSTVTSQIPGGATTELVEEVPGLEAEPASVTISCS
jgi:hypothetical protein